MCAARNDWNPGEACPPIQPGHMALEAVTSLVIAVLASLQDTTLDVLAQARASPTENQRLVGQQPTVLATGYVRADLPLDPVHQVGLQRIDQGLGDEVGAALATTFRHRLPQTHFRAQLARGVHHVCDRDPRNLGHAHPGVVPKHEDKGIALRVARGGHGDFDEPLKLSLVQGAGAFLSGHVTSVIRLVKRNAERETSGLFFDDNPHG